MILARQFTACSIPPRHRSACGPVHVWALLLISLIFIWSGAVASNDASHEIIVVFHDSTTAENIANFEVAHRLVLVKEYVLIKARHYRAPDDLELDQVINRIDAEEIVQSVEPNRRLKMLAVPNDTHFGGQWYLSNTGQIVNNVVG